MAKTRKPKKPKTPKKPAKERVAKYDEKLTVDTNFEGLKKALVTPNSHFKKQDKPIK